MPKVLILVEGQTEETFVKRILYPTYQASMSSPYRQS